MGNYHAVFVAMPKTYATPVIDRPITGHDQSTTLSPAQRRFARKNRAMVGGPGYGLEGLVFLYREGPMLTRRWLVDRNGHVISHDTFARSSPLR